MILFGELLEPVELYAALQELLAQRIADNQLRPLLVPPRYYDLLIRVKDASGNALDEIVVLHQQCSDAARELNLHGGDPLHD